MSLPRFFAKRVSPFYLEFYSYGERVGLYKHIEGRGVEIHFRDGGVERFALMLAHVATTQWSDYIVEQGGDITPVYFVGYTAEEFEAKWEVVL